jgi:hypothetical protein
LIHVFVHPLRTTGAVLGPGVGTARIARADGVWVLDARRSPVLACTGAGPTAVGVLVELPDTMRSLLDMLWRGPGIEVREGWVTASLRREPALMWCLPDLRHARMHGYKIPRVR